MNSRKVFGSLFGFVVLAGVSYHQVRDEGPDPRDTAIMAGTAVAGRTEERAPEKTPADEDCEQRTGSERTEGSAGKCPEEERR